MQQREEDIRLENLLRTAGCMVTAARTAPKAKGMDLLEAVILSGGEVQQLADKMKEIGNREGSQVFIRDAGNLRETSVIVLLGTKGKPIGLRYCGMCGFPDCDAMQQQGGRCIFNPGDLGIAVGSAVSIAADHRVDNRVLYTAGMAAREAGFLSAETVIAFGIPLSATGKNPYFDRM